MKPETFASLRLRWPRGLRTRFALQVVQIIVIACLWIWMMVNRSPQQGHVPDLPELLERVDPMIIKSAEDDDDDGLNGVVVEATTDDVDVPIGVLSFKQRGSRVRARFGNVDVGALLAHEDRRPDHDAGSSYEERWDFVQKTSLRNKLRCDLMKADTEEAFRKTDLEAGRFFSDEEVLSRLSDCPSYLDNIRTVVLQDLTDLELQFPLAFSIVAHSQLGLLEAQLASIVRPHNAYCIHVDKKAPKVFRDGVEALVSCYQHHFQHRLSLFIVPDPRPVYWSHSSLLMADLDCLRLLLQRHPDWRVFINQAGSALPQMHITDMVEELARKVDGSGKSSVISAPIADRFKIRYDFSYELPDNDKLDHDENANHGGVNALADKQEVSAFGLYRMVPRVTKRRKIHPPFGLTLFKGLREVALSREDAHFFLTSTVAKIFLDWCQDVTYPEEVFFATLIRIDRQMFLQTGEVIQDVGVKSDWSRGLCIRRSLWEDSMRQCHGKVKRFICNLGLQDLPELMEQTCFFANKFDMAVDSGVVTCLHQHLTDHSEDSRDRDVGNMTPF